MFTHTYTPLIDMFNMSTLCIDNINNKLTNVVLLHMFTLFLPNISLL